MIDLEALSAAGFSNKRLKEIFTATEPKQARKQPAKKQPVDNTGKSDIVDFMAIESPTDWDIKTFLEKKIVDDLNEAMDRNAGMFSRYGAIDLAYESDSINRIQLPFQKVAQGLINLSDCQKEIESLSPELSKALFTKKGSDTFKVNLPRLFEISHNLVHSLVTRRVAAIATPIAQRFPFMKYESRSTTQAGRLRADLMTQRAEIMADQYGYRNDAVQSVRAVSLYGHQIEFKRSAWDKEVQTLRKRKVANGASKTGADVSGFDEVIVREGVEFISPHPSRAFWDISESASKINTDTGPSYIGYWDLSRLGDIRRNTAYFNLDKLAYDSRAYEYIAGNSSYFRQYYRDTVTPPSNRFTGNAAAFSLNNDRKTNIETYAQSSDQTTTTLAQYFLRMVPKDYGIGSYEGPVWVRFVLAGNKTVIFSEICGSAPACYYNYNESDDRLSSPTFAQQAMPYQDQISNLLTQLIEIQQQGLTRIINFNTDGMTKEQVEQVERSLQNREYYAAKDIVIKYSLAKIKDRGDDPKIFLEKIRLTEIQTREKITEIFGSIIQLLSIAERLLFFSPQELGQVSPREVTATEANMVNSTTLGIRDFHGLGIDMGLDAKKRIIYESTITFGSNTVELPAAERYDKEVVTKAGWTIIDDGLGATSDDKTFTLSGTKDGLVHDYVFTSRDGFDRPLPSAEATALVTALDVASRDQVLSQAMTYRQKFDLYNDMIRKISGVNIRLQVPPGTDPDRPIGGGQQTEQAIQTLAQAVQQINANQQKNEQGVQQLAAMLTELANSVQAMASVVQKVSTKKGEVNPSTPGNPPIQLSIETPRPAKRNRRIKLTPSADGTGHDIQIEEGEPSPALAAQP